MASRMKVKFDKYWNEYSVTLALGCVLDSRFKLNFMGYFYKRLYPYDHQEKVNRVRGPCIYSLMNIQSMGLHQAQLLYSN